MNFFIKTSFITTIIVISIFLQSCSSLNGFTANNVGINELVIAEPLQISLKQEIAIARYSEILQRATLTDEERAQLYYDRGVVYDGVGLRALARFDFNLALRLNINLVDAYNFIGIHYTESQEFLQAYDAFDSVLELEPNHEYAHLNRGIALYYGGRAKLGIDDLAQYYQQSVDDPYRVLWMYILEHDIDEKSAQKSIKERAVFINDDVWAKQLVALYAGEISQKTFVNRLTYNIRTQNELSERLCEAYFYLGKYNQMQGNLNIAANYYKLSLSTNVYEFVEHRYAKLELDIIRDTYKAKLEAKN